MSKLEGTEDPQITMETTVLIPGPPFQQNADLEDLVRQQKSKDIKNNLLSRIKNLKEVSQKVGSVLREKDSIVCETLASYESYEE